MSKGFTLTETLVVTGVMAGLIAITLPAMSKAREKSREALCATQLHDYGTALTAKRNEDRQWRYPHVYPIAGVPDSFVNFMASYMDVAPPKEDETGNWTRVKPFWCPQDRNEHYGLNVRKGMSYDYLGSHVSGEVINKFELTHPETPLMGDMFRTPIPSHHSPLDNCLYFDMSVKRYGK